MSEEAAVTVIKKIIITNGIGKTVNCSKQNCFNFVFVKCSDNQIRCKDCATVRVLTSGEEEGEFPRKGMEYWDRYNQLPNYSFLLDGTNSVRKVEMKSGNWKEGYAAGVLMEEAQAEINSLKARLARLELKAVK